MDSNGTLRSLAVAIPLLAGLAGCGRATKPEDLTVPPVLLATAIAAPNSGSVLEARHIPSLTCGVVTVEPVAQLAVTGNYTNPLFDKVGNATLVSCSSNDLPYHRFGYNGAGGKLYWEGVGTNDMRMFVAMDGQTPVAIKVTKTGAFGSWVQSGNEIRGQDAIAAVTRFINSVIDVLKKSKQSSCAASL
jgi:hypothetical protein